MKRIQSAIAALDEFEGHFRDWLMGIANQQAITKTEALMDRIRWLEPTDTCVLEKTENIKEFAGILYSARKHRAHGSPERVGSIIVADCTTLRGCLERLSESQESAG